VREEKGHQGERERDADRRGGRVDGERRQLDAEELERLVRERQRDEADHVDHPDEEHQRRHVGEPAADRLVRQPLLGDLRLRDLVDDLAHGLPPAGLVLRADLDPHQQDPDRHRQDRAEDQVRHGLVDREVERAELDRDPLADLEVVLRVELLLPTLRRGGERERRQREPSRQGERDQPLHEVPPRGSPEK
jgi:hypothetical protein